MVDTGCGHDLLGERQVKKWGLLAKQVSWTFSLNGIGGASDANEVANNISVGELNLRINPYILKDGFAVMAVGKHCREDKLDFIWLGSRGLPP